jgi:hypothetical protein
MGDASQQGSATYTVHPKKLKAQILAVIAHSFRSKWWPVGISESVSLLSQSRKLVGYFAGAAPSDWSGNVWFGLFPLRTVSVRVTLMSFASPNSASMRMSQCHSAT